MHNCREIKDLILTDYTDGQMEASAKLKLESHLNYCPSCQAFANEVKNLAAPFAKADRQEVPKELWMNIQQEIQQQQEAAQGVGHRIKEWLQGLTLPKLVPALVSFSMFFFITSMVYFDQQIKQADEQEAGSYVSYVLASESKATVEDINDLGTAIESYFL